MTGGNLTTADSKTVCPGSISISFQGRAFSIGMSVDELIRKSFPFRGNLQLTSPRDGQAIKQTMKKHESARLIGFRQITA